MRREGGRLVPSAWPAALASALGAYGAPVLVR
jgi:hypothetical protein